VTTAVTSDDFLFMLTTPASTASMNVVRTAEMNKVVFLMGYSFSYERSRPCQWKVTVQSLGLDEKKERRAR
jgi:ABC-type branched-subunit amino acid transport system substrate-binding protein